MKKNDSNYRINLRTLLPGIKDNFVKPTWFLRINFSSKFLPGNTFNIIRTCYMCRCYVIIIASVISFWSCGDKSKENGQLHPEEYPVAKVFRMNLHTPVEYVANVQAVRNVEIRARVNGYLEHTYIDEGKMVKSGQLLFKISDQEYNAELNKAKASVVSAEAQTKSSMVELERVKILVNKNIVAQTELDLAEANLEIARSKIELAKAEEATAKIKIANTSIRSPFDGIIDRLPFKRGSLISEGSLLTTISDVDQVFAYFKVSEVEYLEFYKAGVRTDTAFLDNVELLLADETVYPFKGKIETMGSEFEEGTGAIAVRARFKNPNHILKHGSTGKVRLHEVAGDVLLIPQKSVLEIQDKNYVLVLDKNNSVQMKSFVPLRRFGDYYIVSKGLNENDTIVYEGTQYVREGMVIKPRMVSKEELLKSNSLNQE